MEQRMRWAGLVALIGEINAYIVLVGIPKGRDHSENRGAGGSVIFE
jgi:hypothetical protein